MADTKLTTAAATQLRKAGLPVEAFSPQLQAQLAKLSDEEIKAVVAIKARLNAGLSARLRAAADTVGGFVW